MSLSYTSSGVKLYTAFCSCNAYINLPTNTRGIFKLNYFLLDVFIEYHFFDITIRSLLSPFCNCKQAKPCKSQKSIIRDTFFLARQKAKNKNFAAFRLRHEEKAKIFSMVKTVVFYAFLFLCYSMERDTFPIKKHVAA